MYTFCIIMITIASILLILAVLVQAPKSGMAANFGAANQTMGVRQTTDFLEKFTWAMVAAIVFFSLLSVTAYPAQEVVTEQSAVVEGALNAIAPDRHLSQIKFAKFRKKYLLCGTYCSIRAQAKPKRVE